MGPPLPTKSSRLQPRDWIRAALSRLASTGIESVRIELLARDLGVSKGSFYWHFNNRRDLLLRMLLEWEEQDAVWQAAASEGGLNAAERWARLMERGADPSEIRLFSALSEWARQDPHVAARLAVAEKRRLRFVAGILRDTGFPAAAAAAWSEVVWMVYLGWLDRASRDDEFRLQSRGLGDFLSELVLAASAHASVARR